jgi:acetyltransferase-like isoleucine patch superfamily enzyme
MSGHPAVVVRNSLRRLRYAVRYFGTPVRVHPSAWVSAECRLSTRRGGSISIGRNCELHPMAMILTYGGDIRIGDDCSLNPFAVVYGHGGVRIGNGVRIATHAVIIPANHTTPHDGTPLRLAPVSARGIEIGDNVWIGAGARILDGVRIGDNAVVGAGSVVTRDVAAHTTVAGVPARTIRQR